MIFSFFPCLEVAAISDSICNYINGFPCKFKDQSNAEDLSLIDSRDYLLNFRNFIF